MECHGTGTPLGDPIEIGGLKSINGSRCQGVIVRRFKMARAKNPLILGERFGSPGMMYFLLNGLKITGYIDEYESWQCCHLSFLARNVEKEHEGPL